MKMQSPGPSVTFMYSTSRNLATISSPELGRMETNDALRLDFEVECEKALITSALQGLDYKDCAAKSFEGTSQMAARAQHVY